MSNTQQENQKISVLELNKTLSILILSLIACSCTNLEAHKSETANETVMEQGIIPFLTFQKYDAEQAINFYVELFDNSKIIDIQRWGKEGPGKEGTIMHATFQLNGLKFMCSDSPPIHNWDFTPAISNYVECASKEKIERLFSKLSENGKIAMPLDKYSFSKKFGWVVDRFGVSWQLNLK